MPQSITIAAFVFGAVLLLIALVGGGFKIFGAEVSGKAGGGGRFIAGLGGVVLLCIGLFGSFDKTATPGPSPTTSPATSPTTSNPQPATTSPATSGTQQDSAPATKSRQSDPEPPINNLAGARDTDTQPIQAQQTPVEQDVSIGGIWRDSLGTVYEVSQQGSSYTFRASGRVSGVDFVSAGKGTVRGHQLESTYETQYVNGARAFGRCAGTVSLDGRQTRSTCADNINGQWEAVNMR